jgi:hypothetical protein
MYAANAGDANGGSYRSEGASRGEDVVEGDFTEA